MLFKLKWAKTTTYISINIFIYICIWYFLFSYYEHNTNSTQCILKYLFLKVYNAELTSYLTRKLSLNMLKDPGPNYSVCLYCFIKSKFYFSIQGARIKISTFWLVVSPKSIKPTRPVLPLNAPPPYTYSYLYFYMSMKRD